MKINIAIDGPSAAGKSTIAKLLAKKYNYTHLDTGAMYRLTAYKALNCGIALDEEDKLETMILSSDIDMRPDGTIYLDGNLIGDEIRTNEMSMAASNVSKLKKVRAALVKLQQKIAQNKGYILDGRDIGTVVLTDAEVKVFMVASAESRAKRRMIQNDEKGITNPPYEQLLKEIEDRDYQDSHRSNSPLKQADDAVLIDTSNLTIEETVDKISELVEEKIG